MTTRAHLSNVDKMLAFGFGVVFVSVILLIAVLQPNPSQFSYTIFRIVIALAAAGVGAVLPGFLEVTFRGWLRAGGALALFAVVYFVAPAGLSPITSPLPPPPPENARAVAEAWLQKVDAGELDQAYTEMAGAFREKNALADVRTVVDGVRANLDPVVSRTLDATSGAVNPPGAPPGHYQSVGFRTKFAKEERLIYEAVQMFAEDGKWKVVGFYLFVRNDAGVMVPYSPPPNA
ncbi:DUF4019 domain-containing protein [Caulobacter sp. NIBR2454]|uniref:DUF4019 domain-containing protein n=1 Tax=Caulobacter sp. NIBR2454 TaxID=3015996 RepID=UPI0022B60828|nr:DUF4019 domain-containing protein [Caulobacter sp. NIBR2454]